MRLFYADFKIVFLHIYFLGAKKLGLHGQSSQPDEVIRAQFEDWDCSFQYLKQQ